MKERPILFSAPMVRALLAGTKTQTRRIVKGVPDEFLSGDVAAITSRAGRWAIGRSALDSRGSASWPPEPKLGLLCPYGQLWVRESHRLTDCECPEACRQPGRVWYEATMDGYENVSLNKLRPSIHMPRWASRITLEITGVRVERLQEISEKDAEAEGIEPEPGLEASHWRQYGKAGGTRDPIWSYQTLWESINGPGSWEANPWVWVVSFKRAEGGAR